MSLMSVPRLKALARKGQRPDGVMLRKEFVSTVTALSDRVLRFVISTPNVDRENDTVAVDGWDLVPYRRNPVVLWAHEQCHLPIGKALDVDIEDGMLKANVQFVDADVPHVGDKAEAILRLCKDGFLSATSVGFRPLEYDIATSRDDGESWYPPMNFLRQELLEFSIVTVPANAEALIEVPDLLSPGPTGLPLTDPSADAERAASEAVQRAKQAGVARSRALQALTLAQIF